MDLEGFLALARSRRSVRRFLPRAPSREELEPLFEAARWAPSNHNRQGTRFVVLEDPAEIRALAREVREGIAARAAAARGIAREVAQDLADGTAWLEGAPRLIVVLHRRPAAVAAALLGGLPAPDLVSGEPLSAAMAIENLLLAARAAGLGACVLTAPLIAREAIAGIPGLPAGFEPTALIAVGHPAEEPAAPPRKEIDEIVEYRPGIPVANPSRRGK